MLQVGNPYCHASAMIACLYSIVIVAFLRLQAQVHLPSCFVYFFQTSVILPVLTKLNKSCFQSFP
jgi:hypothetical protein